MGPVLQFIQIFQRTGIQSSVGHFRPIEIVTYHMETDYHVTELNTRVYLVTFLCLSSDTQTTNWNRVPYCTLPEA